MFVLGVQWEEWASVSIVKQQTDTERAMMREEEKGRALLIYSWSRWVNSFFFYSISIWFGRCLYVSLPVDRFHHHNSITTMYSRILSRKVTGVEFGSWWRPGSLKFRGDPKYLEYRADLVIFEPGQLFLPYIISSWLQLRIQQTEMTAVSIYRNSRRESE